LLTPIQDEDLDAKLEMPTKICGCSTLTTAAATVASAAIAAAAPAVAIAAADPAAVASIDAACHADEVR
tara:strand:- start:58 stop:264 length:207 start_codon:yes stop_codon:yes gene_type:complete